MVWLNEIKKIKCAKIIELKLKERYKSKLKAQVIKQITYYFVFLMIKSVFFDLIFILK